MQYPDLWEPSKFIYRRCKLIASRDPKEVGVESRLISDLVAAAYSDGLARHASGRLLDLGCGKVPLFHAYKDHVSDNVCIDWPNTRHRNKHVDLEHDLMQPLPFPDEEFDTIILSDVLEHLPQPEKLFGEMSRILSRGGKIIMNVPFYYRIHERPYDYYRYTEFALRRFVDISGLDLVQLESLGGIPEVMTDLFAKTVIHIPVVGRFLASFFQNMTAFFIKTSIGETVSNKTKNTFPLGYFLIAEKPDS